MVVASFVNQGSTLLEYIWSQIKLCLFFFNTFYKASSHSLLEQFIMCACWRISHLFLVKFCLFVRLLFLIIKKFLNSNILSHSVSDTFHLSVMHLKMVPSLFWIKCCPRRVKDRTLQISASNFLTSIFLLFFF